MSQKIMERKALNQYHEGKKKKDELKKELALGKLTSRRTQKEWKKICESVTIPILREELMLHWSAFEKLLDVKDFIISLQMDELQNQEDIYMKNFQNHHDNMSRLMENFFDHFREIHDKSNSKLKILIQNSLNDWQDQIMTAEDAETNLKIMMYGSEMQQKVKDKHARTIKFGIFNEENTKNIHERNRLSYVLEKKFGVIWRSIVELQEHMHRINKNGRNYHKIKATVEASHQINHKELRKIMNLNELIRKLTAKSNQLTATLSEKLNYLKSEKDNYQQYFYQLRDKLQEDMAHDQIKRTLIAVEFIKTFEYFEIKMRLGERLIKALKLIRNFETVYEKVLPYPGTREPEERSCALIQLKWFWQKVAEVQEVRYTLNEERVFLKLENKRLQKEIHRHCQCLDCPSLPPIPKRAGKVPYTEGKHMIRKLEPLKTLKFDFENEKNLQ